MTSRVLLALAHGFGVGRVRLAPGTFGSLLGLLWFLVLVWPRHFGVLAAGAFGGVLASVWVCGAAERILERTDPPSVVLDEIVAVPLCYVGWVAWLWLKTGEMPSPGFFFTRPSCWGTAGVFVAFRVFDIAKPWPISASQRLPGGWGVTLDDVMAACYVNAAAAALWLFAR